MSPVFWVCAHELKFSFLKPVTVTIPHCLDLESSEQIGSLGLTFLKGEHNVSSQQVFQFQNVKKSEVEFHPRKGAGTLNTSHFCSLCIAAKICQSLIKDTKFCIYAVIPRGVGPSQVENCVFFISYMLSTCIETIKKQVTHTEEIHHHKYTAVKFKFRPGFDDPAIEIELPNSTSEEQIVGIQGKNKVCYQRVFLM